MGNRLGIVLAAILLLTACKENVNMSNRYVFRENTIIDYLKNHPDSYSSYVDLLYKVPVSSLSKTTVGQLLSARGNYTVFAPTNKAIQDYLDTLAASEGDYITAPSWDAFTDSTKLDSIRKVIVLNSIIDSGDNGYAYMTYDFPQENGGEFGYVNMNDKKLSVYYSRNSDSIFINKYSPVNPRNQDIVTLNGYIHQMERVVAPGNLSAAYYLQRIIETKADGFLVMARAIEACGLFDTLQAIRDEVYEDMYHRGLFKSWDNDGGRFVINPPRHRLYGFTIFAAPDDFWRAQGIDPQAPDLLSRLVQWIRDEHQYSDEDVFTVDENYKNPENLLYQWTTYHILPMRVPSDKLIIHNESFGSPYSPGSSPVPVTDYFITFGKRRLIKVYESRQTNGICLNRFPKLDNGRIGSGSEIGCDPDKEGIRVNVDDPRAVLSDMSNCCIYPLDRPLAYDDKVRDNLSRERLRIDVMSMLPETMTNDIRCKRLTYSSLTDENFTTFPPSETYDYCQDMRLSVESRPRYSNYSGTTVMFGDELLIYGNYDVILRFPPVPRTSTYEVRLGYIAQYNRGIAQFYFGTNPDNLPVTGIPIDMTRMGENLPGYEIDSEDQEYNAELDKRMRNYGLMKGPLTIPNCRADVRWIRCIVAKMTITPNQDYYLRMKSVIDSEERQSVIDFFELCPKEVYDNPEAPEDIW